MSDQQVSEQEILTIMKRILTDIAKETFTRPGIRHPLCDATINNMRECLKLISVREVGLSGHPSDVSASRPRYVDEAPKNVVISMSDIKSNKTKSDTDSNK